MQFERQSFVYILSNWNGRVLYIGVTNHLKRRVLEHKRKMASKFTKQYNVDKLVYYEVFEAIEDAIYREKQLKSGPRKNKIALINTLNPNWAD